MNNDNLRILVFQEPPISDNKDSNFEYFFFFFFFFFFQASVVSKLCTLTHFALDMLRRMSTVACFSSFFFLLPPTPLHPWSYPQSSSTWKHSLACLLHLSRLMCTLFGQQSGALLLIPTCLQGWTTYIINTAPAAAADYHLWCLAVGQRKFITEIFWLTLTIYSWNFWLFVKPAKTFKNFFIMFLFFFNFFLFIFNTSDIIWFLISHFQDSCFMPLWFFF